jgi:hypothetical protein
MKEDGGRWRREEDEEDQPFRKDLEEKEEKEGGRWPKKH